MNTPRTSRCIALRVVLACAAATAPFGCVADGPQGKPPPRAMPAQPAGTVPTVLEVAATRYAGDSDKNGYADELMVTAFLFAPPRDIPVTVPGAFEFTLTTPEGQDMGAWKFDEEASARVIEKLLPGPGYRFRFSLLARGSDEIPTQDVQLSCRFVPAAGEAVSSRSPIRITIGKIR